MATIKYITIIIFFLFGNCSFSQDKTIKKIVLKFVPFQTETDMHVNCEKFESSFGDNIKTVLVDSKPLINQFEIFLKKFQIDKRNYLPDVRAKAYLYRNDGTITIVCMSNFSIELDGKSIIIDQKFIKLINKLESH